jgi:hypothetical protein
MITYPSNPNEGRPVLILPDLKTINEFQQELIIRQQLKAIAEQLSEYYWKWPRPWPQKPSLKTWNEKYQEFNGVDLNLFIYYISNFFDCMTADGTHYASPARVIADRIFASCIAEDSPLPIANHAIEKRMRTERRK